MNNCITIQQIKIYCPEPHSFAYERYATNIYNTIHCRLRYHNIMTQGLSLQFVAIKPCCMLNLNKWNRIIYPCQHLLEYQIPWTSLKCFHQWKTGEFCLVHKTKAIQTTFLPLNIQLNMSTYCNYDTLKYPINNLTCNIKMLVNRVKISA